MKIPYGFTVDNSGRITVDKTRSEIVQMIYREYLNGSSLGGLVKILESQHIPSQAGNAQWGRAAIDKLLSNSKYISYIISLEQYTAVQFEKAARSNQELNNDGTTKRKVARYNSQNVLSGLLVCAECGANYRRITRSSGEVVWRCANRVEHGICPCSPSISEQDIIRLICNELGMDAFDPERVKNSLGQILIECSGTFSFEYKQALNFSMI